MRHRCAILDDYQNVALRLADWSSVENDADITVFNEPLGAKAIETLRDFSILCLMRERTPFGRTTIEALPNLKLIVTSGMRNAAIDIAAAAARSIPVCGTESMGTPTAELAFGLMLELTRKIGFENARLKAGAPWQSTLGTELAGKTLGIFGLGKLGTRVAQIGKAFGMDVIAWSQNLTDEKANAAGAKRVSKEELFRQSDFVTIHTQLSSRTRGVVGAAEFALMKPTAYLINTSRGPIVDEAALISALRQNKIAGAGIDVYDIEPLALDHPLRKIENAVITPHLGYVTAEGYRRFYTQMVEDVRAWLDGKPIRVIAPPK
ncbi:MAG TPA: D-2-hydroxyacid dehydrogenase family protein [Xanthobacteraceae bacterium]|nr:D-2-hydroxyacid dehydrogenase family protein [Xanthobacteraceae bacterium]